MPTNSWPTLTRPRPQNQNEERRTIPSSFVLVSLKIFLFSWLFYAVLLHQFTSEDRRAVWGVYMQASSAC